jgi:hypothetical protein
MRETRKIPEKIKKDAAKVFGSSLPLGSLIRLLLPENALKSISRPLKNIKKINPNVDNVSSHMSVSTRLKPLFPIIIPIKISATTTGIIFNLNLCKIMGVKKAAKNTVNNDITDAPCSIDFPLCLDIKTVLYI